MPRIEFFFDCSSPWTYLAFDQIEAVAREGGATLGWRPFLVGGIFNTINPSVYEQRSKPVPAKLRYHAKDLQDWARLYGLKIEWPAIFPVNSVKAMRACLVAQADGCLAGWARAVFEAYWGRGEDISQDAVLEALARSVGLDPGKLLARIDDPAIKQALRANTEELAERGGFGTPTMFLDGDDMYFGNDRLPLLRAALARARSGDDESSDG